MKMGIHDLLRAGDVKRWTIVRTIVNQNVAEHTFNVAMISRKLATILDIDDGPVIKAALEHDLDEIMTGDMPSPVKRRMRNAGFCPDALENRPDRGYVVHMIVKAADYMECILFLQENGVGRHAEQVLTWIVERKDEMLDGENEELRRAYDLVWGEIIQGEYTI